MKLLVKQLLGTAVSANPPRMISDRSCTFTTSEMLSIVGERERTSDIGIEGDVMCACA